ncbi:LOW QUALITY PROTEIN: hypothetical protein TorRG33x02_282580 [Trema orientale]|uniref:Uncharacterized protein n=1 Tax=Trema orientale TaxID=63057 RepID=A0A2P5CJ88_TREOI|nr:LOW QUALITY PROTEIN: hypothetical protein TorRG33x02_282580 [Trema orientale]
MIYGILRVNDSKFGFLGTFVTFHQTLPSEKCSRRSALSLFSILFKAFGSSIREFGKWVFSILVQKE